MATPRSQSVKHDQQSASHYCFLNLYIGMALNIQVNLLEQNCSARSLIHFMPCKINHDGAANITGFFSPYVESKGTDRTDKADRGILHISWAFSVIISLILKFSRLRSVVTLCKARKLKYQMVSQELWLMKQ